MQLTITADQLVEAARQLDQEEFTRGDVAAQLGVEKADLKQAFVKARKAGRLEKVRDDEENTGIFKLGAKAAQGGAPADAPAEGGDGTVGQQV